MDSFDDRYVLLQTMYEDAQYPQFLVDKIKWQLIHLIEFLETGERDQQVLQARFDDFTIFVNSLKPEFYSCECSLENVAGDSITETVNYILRWFDIGIPVETALREREW